MLYVQIFIVAFEKRIKIEPTAVFESPRPDANKFSIWESCEGVVWHQKGGVFLLAVLFDCDLRSVLTK